MENNKIQNLKTQIDNKKFGLFIDSYRMSLLELISLYQEGDIDLKPEYQRNFKWTDSQKSRFIESLFLGLPIPSLFFYQDKLARWEVVDGIQRLSTIYQFCNVLKDSNDKIIETFTLQDIPELTHLNGLTFNDFPIELQREFRKLRLDLTIISNKTDENVKLEVFRRLNGFGTNLNEQELRNSLIILTSSEHFGKIERMANYKNFINCIELDINLANSTPRKKTIKEAILNKKHYEYIIRYLALRESNFLEETSNDDLNTFFDEAILKIINNENFDFNKEVQLFMKTFDYLNKVLKNNSFKKFVFTNKNTNDICSEGEYKGPVRESIFEVIIPGLTNNLNYYEQNEELFIKTIKSLYLKESDFNKVLSKNPGAVLRMKRLNTLSKDLFNGE